MQKYFINITWRRRIIPNRINWFRVVILECSVPKSEIVECEISKSEELKVDGNFAIARTKGVNFSVTKSDKSLFGSAINGEGF